MARFRTLRRSYVAALLAIALLLLAGVRSTVMQAEMTAGPSAPDCGMAGMGVGRAGSHKPDADHKTCAFCAVAGHLPICSEAPPHQPPSAIAWIAWRPLASLGSRGPPSVSPRARGPPQASLTA